MDVANTKEEKIVVDAKIVDMLSNGVCKVELENGRIVTAHLKGIFKNKKIKVYQQDKVKVEFSKYDPDRCFVIEKIRTEARPPFMKKSNSSRKIRDRRH